jgi:hypothetical protein
METQAGSSAPRRWLRRTLVVLVACVILVLAVGSALPAWLSSESGRGWLLRRVSASIPGRLSAAGISLNWSEGQTVESLLLEDSRGGTIARVRLVSADVTLAQFLRGDYGNGRILIEGLELDLVLDDEGRLNLAAAVAAEDEGESEPVDLPALLCEFVLELPASLKADVELRDARVSLDGPALPEPIQLTGVAGHLRLEQVGAPIEFDLSGTLGSGAQARLAARLEGFDDQGRLRASDARLVLSLDAELASASGPLPQLFGAALACDVSVQTSKSGATFELAAKSPRLELRVPGGIEVAEGDVPRLQLKEAARARYTITPELLRSVAVEGADVALAGDVGISVAVASLAMPLDRSKLALDAQLTVDDGRVGVTIAEVEESLTWTGWAASVRKQASGEAAKVELHGRIEEGEVDVEGELRLPADGDVRVSVRSLPLARIDGVVESFTGRGGLLVRLLGPKLDLEGRIEKSSAQTAQVDLRVDAQRLQLTAPLVLDFEQDTVQAKDVQVDYKLAPSLLPALEMKQDLPIQLAVSSFRSRLSRFDPQATGMQAKLELGAVSLRGAEIRGAVATVASTSFAEGLAVRAECRVDDGKLDATGDLAQLWDEAGRLQPAKVRGRMSVAIERLPVARFEPALGDVLNGTVLLDGDGKDANLDVRLASNRLDVALATLVSRGRLRLREPGRLRYTVTPETAWRFLPARSVDASIDEWSVARLAAPAEITLELRSLDAPAVAKVKLDEVRAHGTISLGPVRLDRVPKAGRVSLDDWEASFEGDSLAAAQFEVRGAVESSRVSLGGPILVEATGAEDAFQLGLTSSDRLSVDLTVVRESDSFRLGEPARLSLELNRDLLRQLEMPDAWLRGPLQLDMVAKNLRIPRNGSWKNGEATLQLTVPAASLRVDGRDVALRELSLDAVVAEKVSAELKARLGEGEIDVTAELADRSADTAIALVARLSRFPVGLLGKSASSLIGKTAEVTVDAGLPAGWRAGRGNVLVTARAPQLDLEARLEGGDTWHLARPAKLAWTMTPASFPMLMPDSKMRLARPAVLNVDVTEFTLAAQADSLDDAALQAQAKIPELRLRGQKGNEFSVRALVLEVQAADLRKPMRIGVDGQLEGGAKPGRVHGKLVLEYLGDEHQPIVFAEDRVRVGAELDVDDLLVQPVDALLDMDGYLPAVLGESASGKFHARLTRGRGPIDIVLRSGNLDATIAGQLTRRSIVLRRPVTAKLVHSKALGDKVLPKLGPLFQGIVSTEAPIRVVIPQKGFEVPRPFDLDKVVVPHAMLDIGKVTMSNQLLIRVVKQLARSSVADQTSAWFTPAEVSLRGGVIRYSRRLDVMLDGIYHFSTWGKADLGRGRLDMVLGIMPDTLRRILKVKGVGRGDTLHVKVTGPLAKPRVELGRVVTDLALIRGKDDALRNLPDLARPFAEAALNKLLRKTFKGPPPLGPTADPLPWVEVER